MNHLASNVQVGSTSDMALSGAPGKVGEPAPQASLGSGSSPDGNRKGTAAERGVTPTGVPGRPRLLDLCSCEGGAAAGYQRAGFHVTAVDLDGAALKRNPADVTVQADALEYLAEHGHEFDAIHASFPCQRWTANGANPAASKYPDLITPGRELLNATGRPWVMENVPKAPLRRDLILCGTMFGLRAIDRDGTELWLKRHRVFEANVWLSFALECSHPRGVQWAGVYGGARKDKREARDVRHGGYVPPDAYVQSALLGGVPWMSGKGRRECIPPAYAKWIGRQLIDVLAVAA